MLSLNLVVVFASVAVAWAFVPSGANALQGRLQLIGITVGALVILDMALLTFLTFQQGAILSRRPGLVLLLRNRAAENAAVLVAGRENIIDLVVGNGGDATARYIHVALKWSGAPAASLLGPDGAYPDRRYWTEGEGNVRYFSGGLDKVVLAGRQMPIAEFRVSRPSIPMRVSYRVFCEDMSEIQGEIDLPLREID